MEEIIRNGPIKKAIENPLSDAKIATPAEMRAVEVTETLCRLVSDAHAVSTNVEWSVRS
jgi:hypothetical protein